MRRSGSGPQNSGMAMTSGASHGRQERSGIFPVLV